MSAQLRVPPWRLALLVALAVGSTIDCTGAPDVAGRTVPATPSSAAPSPIASPVATSAASVVIEALRRGGVYVVMRHGPDEGKDASGVDLTSCATQAALTSAARQQLASAAADFASLDLAVATVLASPYCRTLETARIFFGRPATPSEVLKRPASDEATAAIRATLGTVPPLRTNVAFITHREVMKATLGIDPELGDAFVVRPDGVGGFAILGRVALSGWRAP